MPGKGLFHAFGLPEDVPIPAEPCFKGVARGGIGPTVDWQLDGTDDESPRGTDCESQWSPDSPPASFGSGWKRGDTCTFILELEGDANGTMFPWELVLDPEVDGRKGGGEYWRMEEDEDRVD